MQPRRDCSPEVEQARQALAVAVEAYVRTVADCRQRIRAKAEWVRECRRRLAALAKGDESKTTETS